MKAGEFISEREQFVEEYKGYTITVFGSISYCCAALGVRGCRDERQVKRLISKALKTAQVTS